MSKQIVLSFEVEDDVTFEELHEALCTAVYEANYVGMDAFYPDRINNIKEVK